MATLLDVPYMTGKKRIPHTKVPTYAFGGLNLTPDTHDGEYADTLGITTASYPWLTQMRMHTWTGTGGVYSDVFVWHRCLYTIQKSGQDTYIVVSTPGESGTTTWIGKVTAGQKQMAVVNTKLVIYPDKVYVDLTNNSLHSLVTKSETYSSYTITHNSITATGIDSDFTEGDVLDVTGTGISGKRIVVMSTETDKLNFVDNAITLDNNSGDVTVETSVPDLDFICSSNNRLWGVCNADKTVYASALGEPTAFFDYTSEVGSWSTAIGSDGEFTGICDFGGAVLVWKENMLHKILGSYPSEYYMIDYPIYGVQKGSDRSMVVINNVLYYKGIFGVYQYGGNRPVNISEKLGLDVYSDAAAGTDGRMYYISMKDVDGNYHLYTYDLMHGIWVKETNDQAIAFANLDRTLYYVSGGKLCYVDDDYVYEGQKWLAEMVEVTENTFDRKGYVQLNVRLDMDWCSILKIYAKEDRRNYRLIWEKMRPVKDFYIPETTIPADKTLYGTYENAPEVGDPVGITFIRSGESEDEDGPFFMRNWTADGDNLKVISNGPDDESVTLTCYLDQDDPNYGKIKCVASGMVGKISVWNPIDENDVTQLVPIRLGRCDRWQLKFEGEGRMTIRAIEREHVTGSEK